MLRKMVVAGALVIVVLAFAGAAVASVGLGISNDGVERERDIGPNGSTQVVVVRTRAVVLPTESADGSAGSTLPVTTTTVGDGG